MKIIEDVIKEYEEKGFVVCPRIIEEVLWLCFRKMDIGKIQNKESYLPMLFSDEMKNWYYRKYVNDLAERIQKGVNNV